MALALSAILGGGFSRLGYGRRIAVVAAVAAVVRIAGFQAQAPAEHNVWVNVLQYAIPILTAWIALAGVFRQRISRRIDITRRPLRAIPAKAAT
jgi:lipopolysaccharide export system permease protein